MVNRKRTNLESWLYENLESWLYENFTAVSLASKPTETPCGGSLAEKYGMNQ